MRSPSRSPRSYGAPGPLHPDHCTPCHGTGRVVTKHVCFGLDPHNEYADCGVCHGTGFAPREEEWEFPWRKPLPNGYGTAGPKETTVVHLPGADYLVEPTGDSGIHTGRDRFRVECLRCSKVLHANTTGPASHIRGHQRERHA